MYYPTIAITASYANGRISMNDRYFGAVFAAGGIPSFLGRDRSAAGEVAERYDGFIFAGGADVNPSYYGEAVCHESVEIDDARDVYELALFDAVMRTNKPIFGICRGLQLINVALGGSLYQHIDGHRQSEGYDHRGRRVRVTEGSPLAEILRKDESVRKTEPDPAVITVNTFHHQAVKRLAPALCEAAVCDFDGMIEAAGMPEHPFLLAVQWHPELYAHLDETAAALFRGFVRASNRK